MILMVHVIQTESLAHLTVMTEGSLSPLSSLQESLLFFLTCLKGFRADDVVLCTDNENIIYDCGLYK